MKLVLESTTKIVELVIDGKALPARVWEGRTASGIPVHCYITRVAVDRTADCAQFEREPKECRAPSPDVQAIPLRLIV